MTQSAHLPPQSPRPPDPLLLGKPPVAPAASEAGRLMCAGVYLDPAFRDQVIDELYVHEERLVAPSHGFDAARVLAHALRARRTELWYAAGVVAVWLLAWKLTGGLFLAYFLLPCLLLALAALISRDRKNPPLRLVGGLVRWYARLLMALAFFGLGVNLYAGTHYERYDNALVAFVFENGRMVDLEQLVLPDDWQYWYTDYEGGFLENAWGVVLFFLLLAVLAGLQRGRFSRMMAGELSPRRYPDVRSDPADHAVGVRFRRIQRQIRAEQHSPLIMYDTAAPFRGAGWPWDVWHLSVELRPRTDFGTRKPEQLDNEQLLGRIVKQVEALRVPSPRRDPAIAAAVLDRLRELVVDECVFLPAAGLPTRGSAPTRQGDFELHRAGAVEEGGEKRRHFLRIRVGGWDEDVVVTVYVRVHTQGGMLMLEFAPHVLPPVREAFQKADDIAQRHRNNNRFGKLVWALAHAPRSLTAALATLGRGVVSLWRVLTAGHGGARPAGPERAVRELATDFRLSLFQKMDHDRYRKTIQDRVTEGVKLALYEAGWQTGEFEQKIVNLSAGATYVDSVSHSAVNFGEKGTASNTNTASGAKGAKGGGR
ncbi:hypothetical protein [Streptomyces sp. NPDC101132]|uniref:hypothetical protein n=1 Tax=Streptomyces sp. NPDC101132 TaxID=3366110 RepID=UPI00381B8371